MPNADISDLTRLSQLHSSRLISSGSGLCRLSLAGQSEVQHPFGLLVAELFKLYHGSNFEATATVRSR